MVYLLPEIVTCLVPVLRDISQIVASDGPYHVRGSGLVAVVHQPVCIRKQGCGTKGRPVSLRAAPGVCKGSEIRVEFGLTQSTAVRQTTGRVGDCLKSALANNI